MWKNKLEGVIPSSISNCNNLEAVDLSQNGLTGNIPKGIYKLKNLVKLLLLSSNLSGQIPVEIENCSRPWFASKRTSTCLLGLSYRRLGTWPNSICYISYLISSLGAFQRSPGAWISRTSTCIPIWSLEICQRDLAGLSRCDLLIFLTIWLKDHWVQVLNRWVHPLNSLWRRIDSLGWFRAKSVRLRSWSYWTWVETSCREIFQWAWVRFRRLRSLWIWARTNSPSLQAWTTQGLRSLSQPALRGPPIPRRSSESCGPQRIIWNCCPNVKNEGKIGRIILFYFI